MDLVVGYDYHIDNNEEMKMESVRIEDVNGDYADVEVVISGDDKFVSLDFDPLVEIYPITMMHYTPGEARKLAAALILAAEYVEAEVDE